MEINGTAIQGKSLDEVVDMMKTLEGDVEFKVIPLKSIKDGALSQMSTKETEPVGELYIKGEVIIALITSR